MPTITRMAVFEILRLFLTNSTQPERTYTEVRKEVARAWLLVCRSCLPGHTFRLKRWMEGIRHKYFPELLVSLHFMQFF
jgi:hypothetical protein